MTSNRPKGPGGRYSKDPTLVERDAQALELRKRGLTYRAIAAELGIDVHTAHDAVQKYVTELVEEPAAEVRQLELERLDSMWVAVLKVLEGKHLVVQHGQLVLLDGQPMDDDAPVLQAVDRLLKIQERRAKLLGLDSAKKVDMSGGVTYEIVGVDPGLLA